MSGTDTNKYMEFLIEKVKEMVADMITLDVITAKGNYDLIDADANKILHRIQQDNKIQIKKEQVPNGIQESLNNTTDWIDLVKILSRPPNKITILARTHIQLDGDRVDIIPLDVKPETPDTPPETPDTPPETPDTPPETPDTPPETPGSLEPWKNTLTDASILAFHQSNVQSAQTAWRNYHERIIGILGLFKLEDIKQLFKK